MTHSLSCQRLLKSNLRRNSLRRASRGRTFSSGQWQWVHMSDKSSCSQSCLLTLGALAAPSVQVWQEAAWKFWELQCFDAGVTECPSSVTNQVVICSCKLLCYPSNSAEHLGLCPSSITSSSNSQHPGIWQPLCRTRSILYIHSCGACAAVTEET